MTTIDWSKCGRVYSHPITAKHGHWSTSRKTIHQVVSVLSAQPILKTSADGYYSMETPLGFFAALIG